VPILCDPSTWPCYPLLAIRRINGGEPANATLLARDGQPRNVILVPCDQVRIAIAEGRDPLTCFDGQDFMSCGDVAIDWEVNPDQGSCCA
jgi:hypothetical protein